MINRIVGYTLFFYLIVSLLLYFVGVHYVDMSQNIGVFFANVSYRIGQNKWEIPTIPNVQASYENLGWFAVIVEGLTFGFNKVIDFMNFLLKFINIFVQLLQFLFTTIQCLYEYVNSLAVGVVSV